MYLSIEPGCIDLTSNCLDKSLTLILFFFNVLNWDSFSLFSAFSTFSNTSSSPSSSTYLQKILNYILRKICIKSSPLKKSLPFCSSLTWNSSWIGANVSWIRLFDPNFLSFGLGSLGVCCIGKVWGKAVKIMTA